MPRASWELRHDALCTLPSLVLALGGTTRAARVLGARVRDVFRWKAAAIELLAGLTWRAGGRYAWPPASGVTCLRNPAIRARLLACRDALRSRGVA